MNEIMSCSRLKIPDCDSQAKQGYRVGEEGRARRSRLNVSCATLQCFGNEVSGFEGAKKVSTRLDGEYLRGVGRLSIPYRQTAVKYMRDLMEFEMFFRARKLVPKKKEDKEKKEDKDKKEKDAGKSPKAEKREKKKKEDETVTETEAEDKKDEKKVEKKEEEEKKKKKRIKLEVHDVQVFNDDKDVYVWIFDPTPLYKKVIGLLMVIGTIVGCLFPLWPMWLRQGVYYLSLAGIGVFGLIVTVAILRSILFGIIWLVTLGEHNLWILPNLTEDCGFFESFQPWYTYEYCPRDKSKGKDKEKKKKKKKDKDSDEENDDAAKQDKGKENEEADANENTNHASHSESEVSASENGSSVPASPEGEVKKRRPRRADADYVIVKK
ncbi:unnamed protein product [Cylicocyclus nassatus]|uniref:Translocation protein SEC62 n=1 Tax=Cylicocyclus nassatus TaxID=53992 RepID=A0AA36HA97_CYLNA|nr:unnamed protein product [Cylicocyclus nassatus]